MVLDETRARTTRQISCSIVLCEKPGRQPPRLYEIAEVQNGFFTTKHAKAAGFAENTHPYHVYAGNWVRERRGIYRVASFPRGERPDLMLWSL
jgi:hypothetical protein